MKDLRGPLQGLVALVAVLAFMTSARAFPALADQEQQIGAQVYQQLLQKGEIVPNSPLYATLNPVVTQIKPVVDPQYQYPFHFIIVHEKSPNAFSVPGGNVYVTDSLLGFVDNKEELAGVLCHETSHAIHHDVVNLMNKDRGTEMLGTLAQIGTLLLTHGNYLASSMVGLGTNLQEQRFSRNVETGADLKGAETCAQAGFNPYGMVWLFQKFQKSGKGGSMEMMADHPRDDHRVSDLENHFKSDPATFGKYTNDIAKATPLDKAYISRPQTRSDCPPQNGGYCPPPNGGYGPPPNGGYGPPPNGGYGPPPNGGYGPPPSPRPTAEPS